MSIEVRIKKQLGKFSLNTEFCSESGVLGILGASGCGKSMTLKAIAGIVKPDEGIIKVNGVTLFENEKNINLSPQRRHVGYLFQNYALFPNMTVEQNIACAIREKCNRDEKKKKTADMISMMHLQGLEKNRPDQLSGGQQQRTALARMLANQPDVILLDEPFSALDSYLKEQLMVELRSVISMYKKNIILVTHSRDEAFELCDDIAIMDQGKIIRIGRKNDVFENPGTKTGAILTGCKNIVDAVKTGEYEVYVPEWGIKLNTYNKVEDHLCAIGIRAHYFGPEISENQYSIKICECIEEPFAWIYKFRYNNQSSESADIWWRFSKSRNFQREPEKLGVCLKDILLLYND